MKSRARFAGSTMVAGVLSVVMAHVVGCAKIHVPTGQQLTTALPQGVVYQASPDQVWQAAAAIGRKAANCGVLGESRESYVFSWCEHASGWRDLGQDLAAPEYNVAQPVDPDTFATIAQDTGTGYALTTIWVKAAGQNGARLSIRRTYIGAESVPGLGPSRGEFEGQFYEAVRSSLSTQSPPSSWEM